MAEKPKGFTALYKAPFTNLIDVKTGKESIYPCIKVAILHKIDEIESI